MLSCCADQKAEMRQTTERERERETVSLVTLSSAAKVFGPEAGRRWLFFHVRIAVLTAM